MRARKTRKVGGESIREKNIASFARKAAKYAVKKAAKRKISVTVAHNGKIYCLHPDGSKELIKPLPPKVKVKKHTIKIAD
ncbi:MAG TPA: hypothetical protein VIM75_13945 [Ohtaekwangia sp.]|uniref:hypothetical protein n=1 Tax=Ohtaekwangia sp. TaxID=2066019 RepID=UPI002F93CC12